MSFPPLPTTTKRLGWITTQSSCKTIQRATAYVIVYPGQRGRPGDVQKHTTRIVDYLVNSRGINAPAHRDAGWTSREMY